MLIFLNIAISPVGFQNFPFANLVLAVWHTIACVTVCITQLPARTRGQSAMHSLNRFICVAITYLYCNHLSVLQPIAELRKDYVKRAPPVVGEVVGPVRALAAPVLNIAQANNARGEGRVSMPA